MRTEQESNSINRVLKAWGLPSLDEPGVLARMAYLVDDHRHFMTLLRACPPEVKEPDGTVKHLRREMYEAMRPHLRFTARPLEHYETAAKEYAEAAELPVMDEQGFLHPYRTGVVEVAEVELWAQCAKCQKEGIFVGSNTGDAIFTMRSAGWAYDSSAQQRHLCPECLEGVS